MSTLQNRTNGCFSLGGVEISGSTAYTNTGCYLALLTNTYVSEHYFGDRIYNSLFTKKENNTFFGIQHLTPATNTITQHGFIIIWLFNIQ